VRTAIVNRALGVDLRGLLTGTQESLARIEKRLEARDEDFALVSRQLAAQIAVLKESRDNVAGLVAALTTVRASDGYQAAFDTDEPLVTVRIASYQKTEELIEIAVASVLAQTYQNFELIVVNDGPNERTRLALEAIRDPRIRYEQFAHRTTYPEDSHSRWMVAGSPGMNRGADLALGTWIAPLDEDDYFLPDHLEKLLQVVLANRAELGYSAVLQKNLVTQRESVIWSSPPAISQFSLQGALYLRLLHPHFRYDESSWVVGEPGDWNLIRRMSGAGVRMAGIPDVTAVMNQIPYTHK
jgi:hypothetical protein